MKALSLSFLTAIALTIPHSLPAQGTSKNCALLANWRPTSGNANDVWGYTDPTTGKEYCLLCTTTGTFVLDVSNPRAPVSRGFFSYAKSPGWRVSTWRDIKTYGHYAYGVTEAGGGMQIIDLRKPDQPRFVKTWNFSASLWRNTHNIAIDLGTGMAYVCGTRSGMHVIDIKTNPENPHLVTTFRSPYIHDLHIQDGLAHTADIYGNNYMILDVSKLPAITILARVRTPGTRYCHNNWATADNNYSATTNESAGGPIAIWDIHNKKAPKLIASYRANFKNAPRAIPHNVCILDRVLHASHYTEGYRAVDLSNPAKPVEVGYYDTYKGPSSGYNGDWGVYPFARTGNMYLSDRSTGLYIVKPNASMRRYGKGTTGTAGRLPHIYHFGAAYLGNARFGLGVRKAKTNTAAVLVLGGKAANVTVGGLNLLVDLVSPPPVLAATGTGATGNAFFALPMPTSTTFGGLHLFAQCFVLDAGGSSGLAASEGLAFSTFSR